MRHKDRQKKEDSDISDYSLDDISIKLTDKELKQFETENPQAKCHRTGSFVTIRRRV
jgi:hypothetical protein